MKVGKLFRRKDLKELAISWEGASFSKRGRLHFNTYMLKVKMDPSKPDNQTLTRIRVVKRALKGEVAIKLLGSQSVQSLVRYSIAYSRQLISKVVVTIAPKGKLAQPRSIDWRRHSLRREAAEILQVNRIFEVLGHSISSRRQKALSEY